MKNYDKFSFVKLDISCLEDLDKAYKEFKPDKVINLAAQAGVRYSLSNPHAYIKSNVSGFMNVLELCKKYNIESLVYASSSSVYGGNEKVPFSENDLINNPLSIYAATKISNELMAKIYSNLYGLKTTGLRFFSVYGPWGRPDMAIYIFSDKIIKNQPISVFNNGNMKRDFTFITDIVEGTKSALHKNYQCEIFNLGNSKLESLMDLIALLEKKIGKRAKINFLGMQPGDVKLNMASIKLSQEKLDYSPQVSINDGIAEFIDWFKKYHNL